MFNFHCSLDHYAKTGVRVFYLYWFVTIVLRKPISACTSMLNITIQHVTYCAFPKRVHPFTLTSDFVIYVFFFRVWGL